MTVIAVCNQKGGSGKTTMAINLAGAFAAEDKRVLLLDLDPQGSALDWGSINPDTMPQFELAAIDRPQLLRQARALRRPPLLLSRRRGCPSFHITGREEHLPSTRLTRLPYQLDGVPWRTRWDSDR